MCLCVSKREGVGLDKRAYSKCYCTVLQKHLLSVWLVASHRNNKTVSLRMYVRSWPRLRSCSEGGWCCTDSRGKSLFNKKTSWLYDTKLFWQYDLQRKPNLCTADGTVPEHGLKLAFLYFNSPLLYPFSDLIFHPKFQYSSLARFIIKIKYILRKQHIFYGFLAKHLVSLPAKSDALSCCTRLDRKKAAMRRSLRSEQTPAGAGGH